VPVALGAVGAGTLMVAALPKDVHGEVSFLELGDEPLPAPGRIAVGHKPGRHLGFAGRQMAVRAAKVADEIR